jgi:long-chain-fatty-acid--CoA ligase ACSBG
MPLDKLSPLALDWCRTIGSKAQTVTELRNGDDDAVIRAIQSGIDRANENAVSHAQRIQKWTILPRDFTINGGELGKCSSALRLHFVLIVETGEFRIVPSSL